jgi:hypothetical protein
MQARDKPVGALGLGNESLGVFRGGIFGVEGKVSHVVLLRFGRG